MDMSRSRVEVDAIRAEMKRAVRYRDGPGDMNTIYLGGLATAHMEHLMGSTYGGFVSLQDCIDEASDGQIEAAHDYSGYQWILGHYIKAGRKLYNFKITAEEID
jgi:hypothetical protein